MSVEKYFSYFRGLSVKASGGRRVWLSGAFLICQASGRPGLIRPVFRGFTGQRGRKLHTIYCVVYQLLSCYTIGGLWGFRRLLIRSGWVSRLPDLGGRPGVQASGGLGSGVPWWGRFRLGIPSGVRRGGCVRGCGVPGRSAGVPVLPVPAAFLLAVANRLPGSCCWAEPVSRPAFRLAGRFLFPASLPVRADAVRLNRGGAGEKYLYILCIGTRWGILGAYRGG